MISLYLSRADIGETGNIMQTEFVILAVITDIAKNLSAQLVMAGLGGKRAWCGK